MTVPQIAATFNSNLEFGKARAEEDNMEARCDSRNAMLPTSLWQEACADHPKGNRGPNDGGHNKAEPSAEPTWGRPIA